MPSCGPVCAVPSRASTPTVGFGSSGLGGFGNLGYGGLGCGGLGYGGFGYGGFGSRGFGYGHGGLVESASNLGILDGVRPSPVNQIPASQVVADPPACVVTFPGAILSATCEPILVGGNAPCAVGGFGLAGGYGFDNYGLGRSRGYLGSSHYGRRRYSICN